MKNDLQVLEKKLEESLVTYEQKEKFEVALQHYQRIEYEIYELFKNEPLTHEAYGLLAQCYLRQAGMLRAIGKLEEATLINKKEIESARLSGSSISYAQSLFSTSINFLSCRQIEEGLSYLNEAKNLFESGDTIDHQQGVGWYWIILADLGIKNIIKVSKEDIVQYANRAIDILTPINNVPGISRAMNARLIATSTQVGNDSTE
jgi:tetratricopeptide (TPR) repeat protein